MGPKLCPVHFIVMGSALLFLPVLPMPISEHTGSSAPNLWMACFLERRQGTPPPGSAMTKWFLKMKTPRWQAIMRIGLQNKWLMCGGVGQGVPHTSSQASGPETMLLDKKKLLDEKWFVRQHWKLQHLREAKMLPCLIHWKTPWPWSERNTPSHRKTASENATQPWITGMVDHPETFAIMLNQKSFRRHHWRFSHSNKTVLNSTFYSNSIKKSTKKPPASQLTKNATTCNWLNS